MAPEPIPQPCVVPVAASKNLPCERHVAPGNIRRASSLSTLPAKEDIEKLGRQRPAIFTSTLSELGFCFSLIISVFLADYFISGFSTILPALLSSPTLHIPPGGATWPTSALSLAASALLLPLGRLPDFYFGGDPRPVFLGGLVVFSVSSFAASLSPGYVFLVVTRALQGAGSAGFLPAGIALMGRHYARPGPRKNRVFAMYGATAPVGFWIGLVAGGWAGQRALVEASAAGLQGGGAAGHAGYVAAGMPMHQGHWLAEGWRLYFYIGTAASFLGTAVAFVTVPKDERHDEVGGCDIPVAGERTDAPAAAAVTMPPSSVRRPSRWDAVMAVLCRCFCPWRRPSKAKLARVASPPPPPRTSSLSSSPNKPPPPKRRMDWLGTFTISPGMLLFVYGLTDGARAPDGWRTWYVVLALVGGAVLLAAGVYIEGWVAEDPLVPFDVFRVRNMTQLMVGLFLIYGVFGIYLFYSNFYIELVIGVGPLLTSMWFTPWAVGGLILACTSGVLLHVVSGRALLIFCGVCKVVACVLFALMPPNPNYWAWVLPAMVAETACVDVVWTVTNVFVTTNLPSHRQGLAGAMINCSLFLGICVFLGVADVAVAASNHLGLAASYKVAFWVGAAFAGVALVLFAFIDLGSAKSDFTRDEKTRLESLSSESEDFIVLEEKTQASVQTKVK